ncbi:MAG TPA: SulP family inorganic anion transporter [Actinomycetota bacterium]|nr:SulP family inorganic anion transporter [Actinomycetota bacterium]
MDLTSLVPAALRGYRKSWLRTDLIAGITLAAVAIPEVMGYTSIAQTPIVTGLYTLILPTLLFAVLGSSRLLVVGADSATAAILAAGLAGVAVAGLTPNSQEWLAYTSFIALLCGGLLLIARLARLGFLGDFLSASVLIGFLTGVGVQVATGQLPDMLGIPKGTGSWLRQQWDLLTSLGSVDWLTLAFALGAVLIIQGFKRFRPAVPGAIIAVVVSIIVSAVIDAPALGVAVVGAVQGGFPPIGLPRGIDLGVFGQCVGIAFSCFILIIAQSAATSRSFAMRHGQKVDVDRDIVGLSGASFAAGLSGTFVVNGSPTKTQILDELKGRTQLANITMSAVVLLVVMFLTGLLADMPKAVLGAIVFLIGLDLIDYLGLKRIWGQKRGEGVIAVITAGVVCAIGVEQGVILAVVMSIVWLIQRQYRPDSFVIRSSGDEEVFENAVLGAETMPGLIIFRYDAELFYANANRFVDDVEKVVSSAPHPLRWLVLDCSSITDIDYSAAISVKGLIDYVHAHHAHFGIMGADPSLLHTMRSLGLDEDFTRDRVFDGFDDVVAAYRRQDTPS